MKPNAFSLPFAEGRYIVPKGVLLLRIFLLAMDTPGTRVLFPCTLFNVVFLGALGREVMRFSLGDQFQIQACCLVPQIYVTSCVGQSNFTYHKQWSAPCMPHLPIHKVSLTGFQADMFSKSLRLRV